MLVVLGWKSDQCDIPEEWLILSTMPEKSTEEGLSATTRMTFQLLAAAQIKSHIDRTADLFFPTKIDMSSIPPMIDELIDGVTIVFLQMRCDRRGSLPHWHKQHEDHIADRVNYSSKPDDVCPPPLPLVNDTYEEYVPPEVTEPTRGRLRLTHGCLLAPTPPPVDMSRGVYELTSMKKTGLDNIVIGLAEVSGIWWGATSKVCCGRCGRILLSPNDGRLMSC
jgi:hypothetical protein